MEIDCKFSTSVLGYSCEVSKAEITKPNEYIASFKGKHQPKKSNKDVTRVNFRDARVEHFPRNLRKIFPKLKYLVIEKSGLKEISREDLIGLEKLVWLNLDGNQLKSLPDDLFSNMPNLKYVCLSSNKIEFSSSKLVEPIVGNQLELFDLTGNTNINELYREDKKGGCKTIQELMAKIEEKCKPPTSQHISKTAQCGPNCSENAEKQFLRGFNEFRLSGRFTDFVIVVDSTEFPVNKNVLATQSPVMAEMFEVKTSGCTPSKLEISDLSAEAVEAFLAYLYERKLPDAQHAVEIFKLAAKYEVAKLKVICVGIIQGNLDESNAFEIFKLACGPHKSEELKVAAFGKIQEKFGGELDADLVNDPEKLQEIVRTKQHLDDLMNKPSAKKQKLV